MCMKRTNFFFPEQMLSRVRMASKMLGIPMSEFIRRAIESALKEIEL
jgi:predicted DNA-binding protein